jgi:hypothetical protein
MVWLCVGDDDVAADEVALAVGAWEVVDVAIALGTGLDVVDADAVVAGDVDADAVVAWDVVEVWVVVGAGEDVDVWVVLGATAELGDGFAVGDDADAGAANPANAANATRAAARIMMTGLGTIGATRPDPREVGDMSCAPGLAFYCCPQEIVSPE